MKRYDKEIGPRLREAREARGLTIQDVADKARCSWPTVQQIETAKRNPTADMPRFRRICDAVGVDPSVALFGRERAS